MMSVWNNSMFISEDNIYMKGYEHVFLIHFIKAACTVEVRDAVHDYHCRWLQDVSHRTTDRHSRMDLMYKVNMSNQNISTRATPV